MKLLNYFLLVLSILLFAEAGMAYSYQQYHGDISYRSGNFMFQYQPSYGGSAVYNTRRYGAEMGFNPYYAKYPNGNIGAHNFMRSDLDYQYYRNPSLFGLQYSVNNHRRMQSMQHGLYMGSARTGQIRTGGITSHLN